MGGYDLSDEKWAILQPLLPPERSGQAGNPYRGRLPARNAKPPERCLAD